MTDQLSMLSSEQRRQSDELSEMRKMHMDLMRSVAELCGRLDVFNAQHDNTAKNQAIMQSEIKAVASKVDGLMLDQASNKFILDLVRNINKYVVMAAVSALGSGGVAIYSLISKGVGS